GAAVSPVARAATAEERHAASPLAAAFDERSTDGAIRPNGQELNDAAERVGAVQIAAAAAVDLDAIDGRLRHHVPEDPPSKRIVERHAVGEHERTAWRRPANPAQRHALRRWVRVARGRAA